MLTTYTKYLDYDREDLAKVLAFWMEANGTLNTDNGSWVFYFEELDEKFGTALEEDPEMVQMIKDALDPEIVSIDSDTVHDDCFDLNFWTMWCPDVWDECQREWDDDEKEED